MPRGANLRKDSPQRAQDDALIKARWLAKQQLAAPESEELVEDPLLPPPAERLRGTHAFQAVRAAYWARPVISPQGKLVAAELPRDHVLEWESYDSVVAQEAPTYESWRIVGTPLGPALVEPGKLPSLIDPEEVPDGVGFMPLLPVRNGEFVIVVEAERAVLDVPQDPAVVSPEVEVEIIDGVALVGGADTVD